MKLTEYNKITQLTNGQIKALQMKIESLKAQGRKDHWTLGEIRKAAEATKQAVRKLQAEREVNYIRDKAATRDSIKRHDDFGKRTYHVQRAAALAQGLSGERLLGLYTQILNDTEARQFKHEYEDVLGTRITDPELQIEFDNIRQANFSPDEKEKAKNEAGLKALGSHLQTLEGHEKMAIEQLEHEHTTDIDVSDIFKGVMLNIDKQMNPGPTDEYKQKVEAAMKAELI